MNIQSLFEYSALSNLAYVNWTNINNIREIINDANEAERVPGKLDGDLDTLGEKLFLPTMNGGLGWKIDHFQPNQANGFSATLFEQADTHRKVLAIRGTEPSTLGQAYADLLKADLQGIGEYGMALHQAVELFNYMQQLLAPAGRKGVMQLQLTVSLIPPLPHQAVEDYVTAPGVPPQFIWVKRIYDENLTGLGLLKQGDQVSLTGHSLGGHLAGNDPQFHQAA